ncbi:MAG: heterocyst differentiation control protein [Leptolyngbya sp. SIO1E4]|nr:heterocyst differentiation control protein [Leptolyngbya sp. SIO1E4]
MLASLKVSSADRILIYLAVSVMKLGGHRYGAFLDAATTAAKFAIYSSYLEQGKNIRKTSFLHHVEPKRVRAIIKEVDAVLAEGRSLTTLSDQEPYYLIGIPYLWQEKYPWEPGKPRLQGHNLTPKEQESLEAQLPADTPPARLLDIFEFLDLIKLLHTKSQAESLPNRRMVLSEALTEHIKFRLLHSGTVIQVDIPFLSIPIFALARNHYAPKGERERVFTMIDDVSRFCKLMQGWVVEKPDVFRALEVFDVDRERKDEALEELDSLLQAWADKYHQDDGHPMILQLAAGTRGPGDA